MLLPLLFSSVLLAHPANIMDDPPAKKVRCEGSLQAVMVAVLVADRLPGKADAAPSNSASAFKKLAAGQLDIVLSSRPPSEGEEAAIRNNGKGCHNLLFGKAVLVIVVHQQNDWVKSVSFEDLRTILQAKKIPNWRHINPAWPDEPIAAVCLDDLDELIFFAEKVGVANELIKSGRLGIRPHDDGVWGFVASRKHALGVCSFPEFEKHNARVRAVAVPSKDGKPTLPDRESIANGQYNKFTHPIYLCVREDALMRAEVRSFIRLLYQESGKSMEKVGLLPLSAKQMREQQERLEKLYQRLDKRK
ncbi:MAG: substrate-binding domain-containing protein [Gemmataceae bacterium]|nr:substrate-binding domain-containing protein [Gemmataceae bacterium]MCI0741263.1 substrate-binding domain-containing protein [Gemmataceae bacterium]